MVVAGAGWWLVFCWCFVWFLLKSLTLPWSFGRKVSPELVYLSLRRGDLGMLKDGLHERVAYHGAPATGAIAVL